MVCRVAQVAIRQRRTSALILAWASLLTAGRNEVNFFPFLARAARARKVNPKNVKRHMLMRAAPDAVPCSTRSGSLGRVQPQPHLLHPLPDRRQHLAAWRSVAAVPTRRRRRNRSNWNAR